MHCKVVLVQPKIAANIGAVARVMRNFGLEQLVLVAPEADSDDPRGRLLATHAHDILDRAVVVPELGEPVADCVLVAATSARTGGLFRKQAAGTAAEIVPKLRQAMSGGPVALVFGLEDCGLTNQEVARCHYLIHIPTAAAHPALNLAQAVAICIYELCRGCDADTKLCDSPEPPASFAAQERMFAQLRSALEEIRFLYGPKADALMHALRHLLGRAQPTATEVNILLGLARQVQWFCDQANHSGTREQP